MTGDFSRLPFWMGSSSLEFGGVVLFFPRNCQLLIMVILFIIYQCFGIFRRHIIHNTILYFHQGDSWPLNCRLCLQVRSINFNLVRYMSSHYITNFKINKYLVLLIQLIFCSFQWLFFLYDIRLGSTLTDHAFKLGQQYELFFVFTNLCVCQMSFIRLSLRGLRSILSMKIFMVLLFFTTRVF